PENTQVVGVFGQDKTVPELSKTIPYNLFKVDIYQLGNVFNALIEKYPAMAPYFGPLATSMTQQSSDERPTCTASQALAHFEIICSHLSSTDLRSRLKPHFPTTVNGFPSYSGESDSDYELLTDSGASNDREASDSNAEE
ncbi:hypothetical protein B0H16DRAFT_1322440, partial [Mycena metata]